MTMIGEDLIWVLIKVECAAWRRSGHRPLVWWRDDDARTPSESLTRLFDLSSAHEAPLALAVIPDGDLTALAVSIRQRPGVSIIQHGCDHQDRNQGGGFSCEFSLNETPQDISARINASWRRLNEAIEAAPVFAPPWNVLTPAALSALADSPIQAISIYGLADDRNGRLPEINTHIDVMKWRPARFRGANTILLRFWRQLRSRRLQARWHEPIGWLTHHRNLDPDCWAFLDRLYRRLNQPRNGFLWQSVDQLLARPKTTSNVRHPS